MSGEKIYIIPPNECPSLLDKAGYGAAPCRTFSWSFTVVEQSDSVPVAEDGSTVTVVNTTITPDTDANGDLPVLEIVVPPGHLVVANMVWDFAPACPPANFTRVAACKTSCCDTQEIEYCWSTGNAVNVVLSAGRYRVRPHDVAMCLDTSTVGATFEMLLSLEPVDRDYLAARAANSSGCGCGGFTRTIGGS